MRLVFLNFTKKSKLKFGLATVRERGNEVDLPPIKKKNVLKQKAQETMGLDQSV